ncbi:MAG: hypothetical protein LWX56_08175 [Ignavibacteria bacterium]|nr:hypothetical protein [Ignavibacteria bacterium]
MKKIFFIAMVLFACTGLLQAQKVTPKDTIRVAVLENFNAPSAGALVMANVLKLDISAELLDANLKKLRDITKITQRPKKEDMAKAASGGRGTTVWAVFSDMVEEPGTYYVKASVNMSGELGSAKQDVYFMVIASQPTIAAPVKLRDKYFFGEKETFSFATVNYPDPNAYSYQVADGSGQILYKGNGPVVRMDSAFNMVTNCGKKITIKGFYQGKPFLYKEAGSEKSRASSWECNLQQPVISEFCEWKKDKSDENYLISIENDMAKQFFFIYTGDTPGGFSVTVPDIQGLRVASEPENFIAGASVRKSRPFAIVDIKVNEEFMNQMKVGDSQNIKLHVSFRTQFGETYNKDFYAVVIK